MVLRSYKTGTILSQREILKAKLKIPLLPRHLLGRQATEQEALIIDLRVVIFDTVRQGRLSLGNRLPSHHSYQRPRAIVLRKHLDRLRLPSFKVPRQAQTINNQKMRPVELLYC